MTPPSVTEAVRAVIVDDTPDLRLLLRLTLERDGDIAIVGEAEDGLQGIETTRRLQPQLVMLDLAMPVMDGLEALPRIKAACPTAKVVVLSGFEAGAMQERSMRAGADAYLQKGTPPKEILATVRSLLGRDGAHRRPSCRPPATRRRSGRRTPNRHRLRRRPSAPRTRRPWGLLVVSGAADAVDGNGTVGLRQCRGPVAAGTRARRWRGSGPGRRVAGRPLAAVGRAAAPQPARRPRGRLPRPGDRGRTPWDVSVRADGPDLVVSLTPSRTDEEVNRLRQAIRTTAHEIRNPVSLLSGVASVVAEAGASLTEQQKAHLLAAVGRQAAVLERVTDDLLTAAQAGHGTLRVDVRTLTLAPLLREVVQDVAGAQPVEVSVPDDVTVLADRTRVNQMVANLLTNAFKYADGPYVVEVSQVPSPRRPLVRIAVLDEGPGVEEEFRPRLFDEFTRAESTREQGTGLGLYVVRSLAEAHGGRADYEPRDGGGSVFSVHLPAATPVSATA